MTVSTRQMAFEATLVGIIALAVLGLASRPLAMALVVTAAGLGRFALFSRAYPGRSLAVELLFFALCTLVGAANDLHTVVVRGVYAYAVPTELAAGPAIPLWMLLFWGAILRFVFALTRWERFGPEPDAGRVVFGRRSPALALALVAVVVLVTRASVFAFHGDPPLSWLPLALAPAVYALAGRATRHDAWLAGIALVAGPLVEALFIQIAGLHAYALGWIAGVPVWIVLWWALATWIVKDAGGMAYAAIGRAVTSSGASSSPA